MAPRVSGRATAWPPLQRDATSSWRAEIESLVVSTQAWHNTNMTSTPYAREKGHMDFARTQSGRGAAHDGEKRETSVDRSRALYPWGVDGVRDAAAAAARLRIRAVGGNRQWRSWLRMASINSCRRRTTGTRVALAAEMCRRVTCACAFFVRVAAGPLGRLFFVQHDARAGCLWARDGVNSAIRCLSPLSFGDALPESGNDFIRPLLTHPQTPGQESRSSPLSREDTPSHRRFIGSHVTPSEFVVPRRLPLTVRATN